jgi:hypothetical protein
MGNVASTMDAKVPILLKEAGLRKPEGSPAW